jgi:UDP-glucose 4-epimerase
MLKSESIKCFISGGAGFIGSNLAERILQKNLFDEILIYDNLSSGSLKFLTNIINDRRLKFVNGDLNDSRLLRYHLSGVTTVFHLAANPDISKAEIDPSLDFREGTALTQNLLEAMRLNQVKNIVFTSGSGVYGENPNISFSESFGPCMPVSPYGAAKLSSEALISAYSHMFDIKGIALRFANVVGPNQTHGVGFDFINSLTRDKKKLRILGDGTQQKSYIYIDDVLNAIELILKLSPPLSKFDIFNVATNDYITVTEIANLSCINCGLNPDQVSFVYTGGDRGWNGDVPKISFDTSKIRSMGWSNKFTSVEAMKLALHHMAKRQDGQWR